MVQRSDNHRRPVVQAILLHPDELERHRLQIRVLAALAAALCLAVVLVAVALGFGPSSVAAGTTVLDPGSPDASPPAVLAQFD